MLPSPSRRCESTEVSSDHHRTMLERTPGEDVLAVLRDQRMWLASVAKAISTDQVDTVHAPYRWTIRQVLSHVAEGERVFGYRLLRIAAGDPTPLPGWDENAYAEARYGLGNFDNLVDEIDLLRQANLRLLKRLSPPCWDRSGSVSGHQVSVRALAWLTAAHLRHHLAIVQQRLGISPPTDGNRPNDAAMPSR